MRSRTSYSKGLIAEFIARVYLRLHGYRILELRYVTGRNTHRAEIDIIARRRNTLVFVEVKMRTGSFASGREAVTPAKQKRICKGALHYMMKNGLMNRQARFDVIEIQGERVTHIVNAFPYQGPAY